MVLDEKIFSKMSPIKHSGCVMNKALLFITHAKFARNECSLKSAVLFFMNRRIVQIFIIQGINCRYQINL